MKLLSVESGNQQSILSVMSVFDVAHVVFSPISVHVYYIRTGRDEMGGSRMPPNSAVRSSIENDADTSMVVVRPQDRSTQRGTPGAAIVVNDCTEGFASVMTVVTASSKSYIIDLRQLLILHVRK